MSHGSVPDLSKITMSDRSKFDDLASETTTQRKRKHGEDFTSALEDFTSKINATLHSWKADFQDQMAQVSGTVSSMQKDLSKFTETALEIKSDIASVRKEYGILKSLVNEANNKQLEITQELETLKDSVKFISDDYDVIKQKTLECSKNNDKIILIDAELQDLKIENKMLLAEINENNQRERLLNVEFVGIPETTEENLINVVINYATKVGVEISELDITYAHRVTPKVKVQGRPRVIIAKMKSRLLKDNIIAGARKQFKLSKDNDKGDSKNSVFVNEHLTPYNKQLLMKCKAAAKIKQYQYAWSKNGRIYVRKDESKHAIPIKCEEDLNKLI